MNETKLQRRMKMREIAVTVLETRGDDPEVCRQVEALVGSLDDSLSDEFVLEELKALKAGDPTFSKIFASIFSDKSPKIKRARSRNGQADRD